MGRKRGIVMVVCHGVVSVCQAGWGSQPLMCSLLAGPQQYRSHPATHQPRVPDCPGGPHGAEGGQKAHLWAPEAIWSRRYDESPESKDYGRASLQSLKDLNVNPSSDLRFDRDSTFPKELKSKVLETLHLHSRIIHKSRRGLCRSMCISR